MSGELELVFHDQDEEQMDNLFRMNQEIDREIVFHNTVPLPDEQLPQAREKAVKQKEIVLNFFKGHPNNNYTPYEVFDQISESMMLFTSVRRSISDLTKEGRLIKCMYSKSRKGAYGALNRTWEYNKNWMPRLNPQK